MGGERAVVGTLLCRGQWVAVSQADLPSFLLRFLFPLSLERTMLDGKGSRLAPGWLPSGANWLLGFPQVLDRDGIGMADQGNKLETSWKFSFSSLFIFIPFGLHILGSV